MSLMQSIYYSNIEIKIYFHDVEENYAHFIFEKINIQQSKFPQTIYIFEKPKTIFRQFF